LNNNDITGSTVLQPTRHITGYFRDNLPTNHLTAAETRLNN